MHVLYPARCTRFLPLRRHMPMNMSRPVIKRDLTAEVAASVKRIETMWSECRARYGQKADGPFLFGAFGSADAMYAPIVARLYTYGVDVSAATNPTSMPLWLSQPGGNGTLRRLKKLGCLPRTRSIGRRCIVSRS